MKKSFLYIMIAWIFSIHSSGITQMDRMNISENLILEKISSSSYLHISKHQLDENGPFIPANGLIHIRNGHALIIDTPWTDALTNELILFLQDSLHLTIELVIPTHWHIDCMGGLNAVHQAGIPTLAASLTCEIAAEKNLPVPQTGFKDSTILNFQNEKILCQFLGAGHTLDNIVAWIPEEKILFGGCMLKALNWNSLGFLGDADVNAWPHTLEKLLDRFPDAKLVIPGHGSPGNQELIHHTLRLLETYHSQHP